MTRNCHVADNFARVLWIVIFIHDYFFYYVLFKKGNVPYNNIVIVFNLSHVKILQQLY